MLDTYGYGELLKSNGFAFYSGVPCSFLSNLINYAVNEVDYIMSTNEGDAVATCVGAAIAGKKSVVLMQNSGLGNAVSPLTSLNYPFEIGVLGFVSLRGEPGLNDEPQHVLMGTITEKMLSLMEVEWAYLSPNMDEASEQLALANCVIESGRSFFFVVKKGTFDKVDLNTDAPSVKSVAKSLHCRKSGDQKPTREEIISCINQSYEDNTVVLATTGKTGRELYECEDKRNNFYMVGSMGCISSVALGLARNTSKRVIAIDGDGALMMRLGNLVTNAFYAPKNMLHILIDNEAHDSTGGQFTVSSNVDFPSLSSSAGYYSSIYVHDLEELKFHIKEWEKSPRLTMLYIKSVPGSRADLGRPKITPREVAIRLMEYVNG